MHLVNFHSDYDCINNPDKYKNKTVYMKIIINISISTKYKFKTNKFINQMQTF